jgi:hypothetical protein
VFERRFVLVRDRLLEAFPRAFEGTDLDPEASRRKAERLVGRVETLVAELAPEGGSPQAQSAEELAARLRDALATNTIGGRAAVEARWQSAASDVESAQIAWRRLGPLPGSSGRELVERFDRACRRFSEARPPSARPRSEPSRRGAARGPRPAH